MWDDTNALVPGVHGDMARIWLSCSISSENQGAVAPGFTARRTMWFTYMESREIFARGPNVPKHLR
jgi:hypothetical protein